MPVILSKGKSRGGLSAGHDGVDTTPKSFTVVAEITNGTRILGVIRSQGDRFDAIPRQVEHWVRTGVLVETPAA